MDPMIAACLAVVAAMAIGFVVMKRKKASTSAKATVDR
jgi:hypothetical protein